MAFAAQELGVAQNIADSDPKPPVHPMVAAIREGLASESWAERGHFTVPYHKPIGEEPLSLWVRKPVNVFPRQFSIDLGSWYDQYFDSVAAIDFRIDSTIDSVRRRSSGRPPIGVAQRGHNLGWVDGREAVRQRAYSDHDKAIFVQGVLEDGTLLRNRGIATALTSAARVVLADEGASMLVFDEVTSVDPLDTTGKFYQALRGHIFTTIGDGPARKVALPTAQTPRHPYKFK